MPDCPESVKKPPGMAFAGFDMNKRNLRRHRQKIGKQRTLKSEETR
jgi:hypothetical protein